MAAVTNAIAGGTTSTANTTSYASGSFTPTAGDLLVVSVSASDTTDTGSLTASANGITFTKITSATRATGQHEVVTFVANQLVPGSPAAMTVTFDCSADAATGAVIMVARVSGMSRTGAAAVRQSAIDNDRTAGTSSTVTLGAACLTGNPTLWAAITAIAGGTWNAPTGWTKQVDNGYATPTTGGQYASRDSGFTGSSLTNTNTTVTTGTVFLELDTSAALTSVTVTRSTSWNVASAVTATRSTTWNVAARVTVTRSTTWNVLHRAGPKILVEIGDWSQEWELGQDIDPADVTMINAEGAILDGLTAQWSSDRMMAQPTPVEVAFNVYVPEGAIGPSLDEGVLSHVKIVPPDYTPNPDYLPLLDTYGTVTYGVAHPLANGLSFAVIHTDHLAGLGESMVGNVKWKGGGFDDLGQSPPGQQWIDRFGRLKRAMAIDGQTLEWDPVNMWTWDHVTPSIADMDPLDVSMIPTNIGPVFPVRPGEPAPTNEVAEQTLRHATKWGPQLSTYGTPKQMHVQWRVDGNVDLHETVEALRPTFREWSDTYMRPVMFATEDQDRFRLAWVGPRVEGNAGLPLALELTDKLRLTAVPLDGTTIPDSSKYGAWVPGCAVPKDDVEWAVDKDAHPRQVRGTGYFRADVGGDAVSATDWVVGYPYTPGHKGAELQIDLPELTSDTDLDSVFMCQPESLLWSLTGYWYDTLPQYELATLPIRYDAIGDPDQWPRLFQQPDQDSRLGSLDWWAGAQGRFIFVYDIADRWHPYGLSYWWGFLKGATLTVEAGKITATAELAHREAGPNGPRGTPTAVDGSDRWTLLVGDTPEAVTWDQWNADTDLAPLLPADIDPTVRWASLYLTSL